MKARQDEPEIKGQMGMLPMPLTPLHQSHNHSLLKLLSSIQRHCATYIFRNPLLFYNVFIFQTILNPIYHFTSSSDSWLGQSPRFQLSGKSWYGFQSSWCKPISESSIHWELPTAPPRFKLAHVQLRAARRHGTTPVPGRCTTLTWSISSWCRGGVTSPPDLFWNFVNVIQIFFYKTATWNLSASREKTFHFKRVCLCIATENSCYLDSCRPRGFFVSFSNDSLSESCFRPPVSENHTNNLLIDILYITKLSTIWSIKSTGREGGW